MDLYHFTDSRNVASIQRRGLLSWRRLVAEGIVHHPASNALSRWLDERKDLSDFVRLCLTDTHPMAWTAVQERRVTSLAWLTIDPTVLRFGALYSNKNATASDAEINEVPATAFDSGDPQAEVLVPGFVARRWITFPPDS